MPLPSGTGNQISLGDIATEFQGSAPHSLSEYYKNGGYVVSETVNTSSAIYSPLSYYVSLVNGVYYYYYGGLIGTSAASQIITGWDNGFNVGSYRGTVYNYPSFEIIPIRVYNYRVPTSGQIKVSDFKSGTHVPVLLPVEVTFYESRYGADMGTVSVVVVDNNTGNELGTLWTASGNLGVTTWYQRTTNSVNVDQGTDIRIAFKHVAGSNYRADWAVDTVDISVDGTSVRTSNFDTSSTTDGYGGWLSPLGTTTNYTTSSTALAASTEVAVRSTLGFSLFNIDTGSTPSGSTGPTGAQAGTYFAYSETSSYFNGTHWLFSPVITV